LKRYHLFFNILIIVIFTTVFFSQEALSYSSADVPVHHWSYEAVEKLAIAGLLGLSGLDTRPMTRVQMAYKIKEASDTIERERLPKHLILDREYVEYLQHLLYKLINEFRQELILIGVNTAQIESDDARSNLEKFIDFNLAWPLETEHRFVSVESRQDMLLENENGLRLDEGYNLRARVYPWVDFFDTFTFSARPSFIFTDSDAGLFLDEAAAKVSVRNIEASLAKSSMWWGPGYHGSMLMSNNAEPLSLIRIRTINHFRFPWEFKHLGSFGANFFVSRLGKDRRIPRPNFVGLRVEYSPLPYLSLGASRTSIMGGNGRPNPRLKDWWKIFMAKSKDEFTTGEAKRTDTDQLASLDARFVVPISSRIPVASGLEVYGEWAGEDRFSFWENEAPGLLAGVFLTDLFKNEGTDLRIEFARNKSVWYSHGIYNATGPGTAYTHKSEVMGHHMGGDSDDLFFRISKELNFLSVPYVDSIKVGAQLDIERHNLSGAVQEKMYEFAGDVLFLHSDTAAFLLRYELENFRNFGSRSGATSKNHIVSLEGNVKF